MNILPAEAKAPTDRSQPNRQQSLRAQRNGWRAYARAQFDSSAWAVDVAGSMEEAATQLYGALSGLRLQEVRDADYYTGLVTSFLRTQLSVVDAIRDSEVIDGTTLLRKQLEAVARLRELDTVPVDELKKRTPNISVLKSGVKGLYGSYSEIAHSSAKRHFELLGSDESGDGWTSLCPKFSPNSYVLLQNAAMVFGEFWIWLEAFVDANVLPVGESWNLAKTRVGILISCLVNDGDASPV